MRTKALVSILVLLPWWSSHRAMAQEEEPVQYIDYGGVLLPVPRSTPDGPRQIAPGEEEEESDTEGTQSVSGRSAGRTAIDAESGETVQVYQSSRVSGVSQAGSDARFSWFYDAIDLYMGIIPHLRDSLPHIAAYQQAGQQARRPNSVTWIGFQPFDGYTRVFVQCSRAPEYQVVESEEGHVLELLLDRTRLSLSNFSRFMDTSYFDRSVHMIDAEQLSGQRVRLVIWRAEVAPYAITQDGNYLNIDFQDIGGH